MPTGAVLCAEQGLLWYPQLISFTQALRHLMISEKEHPAIHLDWHTINLNLEGI